MTLDGVIQDPTGDEDFELGGWFEDMSETDRAAWAKLETEEALAASAMVFGARSYEWFSRRWAGREGAWGEQLQSLPKYVVTSSPIKTEWGPVTVLSGEPASDVTSVKEQVEGDILVYGSGQLLSTLFDNDLVDEVRLFVFPTALGTGRRLFQDISTQQRFEPMLATTIGDGLSHLVYQARQS
jgi:dihydrofolate reductase